MKKSLIGRLIGGILAGAVLAGCTQLEVRRHPGGIVEGIPYVLPKKSVLVAVEYEVQACHVKDKILTLDVKKAATATQVTEPDEHFYIPYASIRNVFKDIDITVESYDSTLLKSMSAHVIDKTGPAISALVGTALKLASFSTGKGPAPVDARSDDEQRKALCNPNLVRALNELARLKTQAQSDDRDAAIAVQKGLLKFKQVHKWTPRKPSAGTQSTFTIQVYPAYLLAHRWLTADGVDRLRAYHAELSNPNAPIPAYVSQAKLELSRPTAADPELPNPTGGVVVRSPMTALLQVCDGLCPAPVDDVSGIVGAADIVVPQLGDYVVVPLHNRLFQDQKVELAVTEDGVLQKVGINSKATAGPAVDNLNSNLDQVKTFRDAREQAKEKARTDAANLSQTLAQKNTAINEAIKSCLEAQKALKDAGGTPVGTCQ